MADDDLSEDERKSELMKMDIVMFETITHFSINNVNTSNRILDTAGPPSTRTSQSSQKILLLKGNPKIISSPTTTASTSVSINTSTRPSSSTPSTSTPTSRRTSSNESLTEIPDSSITVSYLQSSGTSLSTSNTTDIQTAVSQTISVKSTTTVQSSTANSRQSSLTQSSSNVGSSTSSISTSTLAKSISFSPSATTATSTPTIANTKPSAPNSAISSSKASPTSKVIPSTKFDIVVSTENSSMSARPLTNTSISSLTTQSTPQKDGATPATAVSALLLSLSAVFVVLVAVMLVLYIIKKRKNSYILCTLRSCKNWASRRSRTASSSSQGPLTMEDPATFAAPEPRTERELFSIGDQDGGDDGRPGNRSRRGTEDDYFYDEIFERSAFVDEQTKKGNKHLTIGSEDDDDDELEIPDLVFKKPSGKY